MMRRKRFAVAKQSFNRWGIYNTTTNQVLRQRYQTRKDAQAVADRMNASLRPPERS